MFRSRLSPVLFHRSGSAETYGTFRNLAIDERLCSDNGVIVDPRSFQHRTLSCDPDIVADGYTLWGRIHRLFADQPVFGDSVVGVDDVALTGDGGVISDFHSVPRINDRSYADIDMIANLDVASPKIDARVNVTSLPMRTSAALMWILPRIRGGGQFGKRAWKQRTRTWRRTVSFKR